MSKQMKNKENGIGSSKFVSQVATRSDGTRSVKLSTAVKHQMKSKKFEAYKKVVVI